MMFFLILLAVGWKLGGATSTQRSHTYTNVGLNNKAFTEDVVFESSAKTALHCGLQCNQQDSCMAFTFDDNICRGHAAVMTPRSNSRPAVGALSFYKENNQKKKNCNEETKRGVVTIYPDNSTPLQVYCDQDTDGGGWTVFQRRQDASVDFYRNWTSYQNFFGGLTGNFWLGLDALHMLTSRQQYELRVDLMKWDNTTGYATYSNFSISDSGDNYRLTFGSFTNGGAGDSLSYHRGYQFSTWDRDHDMRSGNCAQQYHSAWWYRDCSMASLNGEYKPNSNAPAGHGIRWYNFGGNLYSHKFSEMKIRVA
ncbi:microfibril-associated glycoprotein 4-like [Littorina saxatilis]|uniref:microfibril-associated glycoprotein 4-like n=1 Tax=Littorina saxatilis TaxID=31220 RepID=UPI0038B6256A